MTKRLVLLPFVLLLHGCIAFTAVVPGDIPVSGMVVQTSDTWNQAPRELTRLSRPDAKTWTRDGTLLDRLLIIPAVPGGEPIFHQFSQSQALPVFQSDMLPNEIEELVESSIVKLFGEGAASVTTSALRPHEFGAHRGIMFDLSLSLSDGPDYRGITSAAVVDGKLYLIIFLAAEPYYYEKHIDEVMRIMDRSTIGESA